MVWATRSTGQPLAFCSQEHCATLLDLFHAAVDEAFSVTLGNPWDGVCLRYCPARWHMDSALPTPPLLAQDLAPDWEVFPGFYREQWGVKAAGRCWQRWVRNAALPGPAHRF